ncbi:MAG: helical backbone metal receptor [Rubricoccaceae bacterium]
MSLPAAPSPVVLLGPPPPPRPQRIVSLVPSLTELLAVLGLDDETVGLTRFCVHPEGWKTRKTVVGGTKNVRLDRVAALRPDLVVANREENVREQVETLAATAPVALTDVPDVPAALATIRALGRLAGRPAAAEALAADLAARFEALAAGRAAPLRALYLIWRGPWMAAGGDTIIHDVLARGGFANVLADRPRYPELPPDAFAALRPDVVLLPSEPYPFREAHRAEVAALAPGAAVVLADGEAFSWYGPRLARAPDELARLRAVLSAAPPA